MVFLSALTVLAFNKNQEQRSKLMAKCAEVLSTESLGPDVVHLTVIAAMTDD
jgi:surface polysaccharide O-acyltransferase-like enzyme